MDAKPMTHEALIDLIGELGRETWNLLDNSEESGPVGEPVLTVDKDCFDRVSAVLDKIDALPFEEPGHILGTGAKLQAALKQTFVAEITALRAERDALAARLAVPGEEELEGLIARLCASVRREPEERLNHAARRVNIERREAARALTALRARVAGLEGEVAAFIEGMDYPRVSPDAEEARCYDEMLEYMGRCWEAHTALSPSAQEARDAE